ncbi:MAG: BCCT family transporter [Brachybacterium sp.]|uniref:BCCT family transporter n=1 Tax=Brachybacterium sp. TaxID=1891286 RepID=UPI0026476AD2|nr:BCCT family transporter [Brachybacterium sp.]MDN5688332.1 BCCT family transporter [Brachybacterium sp.]
MLPITADAVILLTSIFFVSGADAGALVLATLPSRGRQEPWEPLVVLCAVLAGVVAAMLLLVGGLQALRTSTILTAMPSPFVEATGIRRDGSDPPDGPPDGTDPPTPDRTGPRPTSPRQAHPAAASRPGSRPDRAPTRITRPDDEVPDAGEPSARPVTSSRPDETSAGHGLG